ncbi:MAG: hypothetical protein ACOCXF_02465 [bacterium]
MDFNKSTKGWTLFAYDRNEKSLWYKALPCKQPQPAASSAESALF